jgi:predicted dehydrogenase
MKAVIVGLGVQGKKRKIILNKNEFVYTVDPFNKEADFNSIKKIPLSLYDTVFICTPESEKLNLISFCLENKKHFLIEKPFPVLPLKQFNKLRSRIENSNQVCYVGYNTRFEPYIVKLKKFLKKKIIGRVYSCKIFYGNGTARLIKSSYWRDNGHGVIDDLFPHIFDLLHYFYENKIFNLNLSIKKHISFFYNKFENKTADNAVLNINKKKSFFSLEASYCSWKNSFCCEIIGNKGSLHLNSLSKWGEVILKFRKRMYPSGSPNEKVYCMKKKDITFKQEYNFFKKLILKKKNNNLSKELWINQNLYILKKKMN